MKRIVIKDEFKEDFITREAGERLRLLIEQAAAAGTTIELDFTGLKIASTSYFDEGIAKLQLGGWDSAKLKKFVKFKNLYPGDERVLQTVWDLRESEKRS